MLHDDWFDTRTVEATLERRWKQGALAVVRAISVPGIKVVETEILGVLANSDEPDHPDANPRHEDNEGESECDKEVARRCHRNSVSLRSDSDL